MAKFFDKCPVCESEQVVMISLDYDDDVITQTFVCGDCKYRWYETYELISVRDFLTDEEI